MDRMNTKTWIAEIGEQLEVSETKCESIKSQLGYMKMLYSQGISEPVESKSREYFETDFYPFSTELNEQNQCQSHSKDFQEFLSQQNSQIRDFKNEINKLHINIEETIAETSRTYSKPSIHSLKSLKEENKKKKTDEIVKMCYPKSDLSETNFSSRKKENENFRNDGEILKNRLNENSDQELNLEFPKSSKNCDNSFEDDEKQIMTKIIIREKKTNEIEKDELMLKLSQSMQSNRFNKKKKSNKSDIKRPKTFRNKSLKMRRSNGKINESIITIAKVKKKKGRLRNFNSKSTISTVQNVSLTERKERKRQKLRSFSQKPVNIANLQNPTPIIDENFSDIVELYKNMDLKTGSVSVISSKHSRLNSHFQESGVSSSNLKKTENNREFKKIEMKKNENLPIIEDCFNEEKSSMNSKSKNENIESGAQYLLSYPGNKNYDPMLVRNYEQPTVSSKLKRVQRSYYNRFNFRNIPFIVGTSISPSHNLGLNIQQVLSIMKSKQARSQGRTSILMRKMSQRMGPLCSTLSEIDKQNLNKVPPKNSVLNCQNSSDSFKIASLKKYFSKQQSFGKNTCDTLFEEKEVDLNSGNKNLMEKKEKGNRDVLIKLHDQFEEMNTKYEKLQEQTEKFKDKSLIKELEKLEIDLAAKEEEINAVVGLFKEVMFLKKQVKKMTEKNSFICISTESSNIGPEINYTRNPMIRAYLSPHLQMSKSRRNPFGNVREPSTGTRLTGLLRQIQMFQWQLKQN